MAKIEITVTDEEKARLQAAADRSALKLATWARAHLLLASMPRNPLIDASRQHVVDAQVDALRRFEAKPSSGEVK